MPIAPSPGVTLITAGAVVSGAATVRNDMLAKLFPWPATSRTPDTCTDTVVLPGNALAGV